MSYPLNMQPQVWAMPSYVDRDPPFDLQHWKSPSTIASSSVVSENCRVGSNDHDQRARSSTVTSSKSCHQSGKTESDSDQISQTSRNSFPPKSRSSSSSDILDTASVSAETLVSGRDTSSRQYEASAWIGTARKEEITMSARTSRNSTPRARSDMSGYRSEGSSLPTSHRVTSSAQKRRSRNRETHTSESTTITTKGYSCTPEHTVYAGRGWITPHCLSEGDVQSAITLPSAEDRTSRRLTYEQFRTLGETSNSSDDTLSAYTSHWRGCSRSDAQSQSTTQQDSRKLGRRSRATISTSMARSQEGVPGSRSAYTRSFSSGLDDDFYYINSEGHTQLRMPWDVL